MAREYHGPCIGGPLAGQMLTCMTDRYVVASRRFSNVLRPSEAPRLVSGFDVVYRHVMIGGTGLWAPESENVDTVMRRLLAIYMAAVKEDKEDD